MKIISYGKVFLMEKTGLFMKQINPGGHSVRNIFIDNNNWEKYKLFP